MLWQLRGLGGSLDSVLFEVGGENLFEVLIVDVREVLVERAGTDDETAPVLERGRLLDKGDVAVDEHPAASRARDVERTQLVALELVVQIFLVRLHQSITIVQPLQLFFPGVHPIVLGRHLSSLLFLL